MTDSTNRASTQEAIQILSADWGQSSTRHLGTLNASYKGVQLALPLVLVDVQAKVCDRVSSVSVRQVFANPYSEFLEAVYIFPLSPGAAVHSVNMKIDQRRVKAQMKERGQARADYAAGVQAGHQAALMEQERDDVFTITVGNVPPGKEVEIEIVYNERLSYFDSGRTEIRLPLVVAPRYIPGHDLGRESTGLGVALDTNRVPDASRISPPRLAPGVDPDIKLSLSVEIVDLSETAEISDLSCSQHATKLKLAAGGIKVSLARQDEALNRDFVLQWRISGEHMRSSLLTYKDEDGQNYGMLSLFPPAPKGFVGVGRDVVFVLDRSGSMEGIKMTSAVRACSILLNSLGPRDRFNVVAFSYVNEWMLSSDGAADPFLFADETGLFKGEEFLRKINAVGGTELGAALEESLNVLSRRRNRDRLPLLVVLTDGEVGQESEVLKVVQRTIGDTRLFAVGIDTAANEGVLRRLANLGGGTSACVQPGTSLEEALSAIAREIGEPLITRVEVLDNEAKVERSSLAPSTIPDLFAGRASMAFFKLDGKGKVQVTGTSADGSRYEQKLKAVAVDMPAIAQLWAKARISDLEDSYRIAGSDRERIKQEIISLALRHSVLTRFTAFVAVDESQVVNAKGHQMTVVQPVSMPQDWSEDSWSMPQSGCFKWASAEVAESEFSGAYDAGTKNDSWGAPQSPPPAPSSREQSPLASPGRMRAKRTEFFDQVAQEPTRFLQRKSGDNVQLKSIRVHLEAFLAAFEQAFQQVKSGHYPAQALLEGVRRTLVQALAPSSIGMELPHLQRFLRSTALELIASLGSGQSVSELSPFWTKHWQSFELAKKEAKGVFDQAAGTSAEKPFWGESI